MNLIEAFNAFDSWTRLNTLSANQRSLYIAIVQLWNAAGRPEYSSIPEQKLTELSGLSKKTFYNVRNQLEEFGLIGVVKSKSKNIAPKYTLKDISVKNDDNFTPISTPNVTPILTPKVTPNLAPYTEKSREEESREEDDVVNDDISLQSLSDFFSNNFHPISQRELEQLREFVDDLSHDMVRLALEIAVDNNARKLSYVRSIITNWKNDNIKTPEEYQTFEAERKRKLSGKNQSDYSRQKTVQPTKGLPKWGDEYKLIKAGVDTTGMSQNEMYKLAEEMGLHNDD